MNKEQLQAMSFEAQMEWAIENVNDVTTEEALERYAIHKIENGDYGLAIHILNAMWNNPYDTEYYRYDYSMGRCEEPTPITELADIEDLI